MAGRRVRTGILTALSLVLVGAGLTSATPEANAIPSLKITKLVGGLVYPWDLTWVGNVMLYDLRGGKIYSKVGSAKPALVRLPLPSIFAESEGGLLGIVAHPQAATNRRFYTCQAVRNQGKAPDVQVLPWKLTSLTNPTTAVADGDPLITGIPVTSGRHSGCRLRFGADGLLYVGTGDAAIGTNPQSRQSLGGKVLRVEDDGDIPDNPFKTESGVAKYIYTYGHRNVQGLALRPGTTEMWSQEQGTGKDDETNLLSRGDNYGYDPIPPPNAPYNEAVPMTDTNKYPDAVSARWTSGSRTRATSGLTFLAGSKWGRWEGAAAVGLLKDQGIMVLSLRPNGQVFANEDIRGLSSYGRIRTVQRGPDGALYFTTSNGKDDSIVRIEPLGTSPAVAAGSNISKVGVSAARTNSKMYAYVRTTGNQVAYKKSTNDGLTWGSTFTNAPGQLKSTMPPSVTSSASDRIDLVTQAPSGNIALTSFVNDVQTGQINLGGPMTVATVSSLGDGTIDVFGLGRDGIINRKHFDQTWSAWTPIPGQAFTSAVGASADRGSSGSTIITARGTDGATYERTLSPSGNGTGWVRRGGLLWSARALTDRFPGKPIIGISQANDTYTRMQQDPLDPPKQVLTLGLPMRISSAPDVVGREDGTWIMFGRNIDNQLVYYDTRGPGGYVVKTLGGTLT